MYVRAGKLVASPIEKTHTYDLLMLHQITSFSLVGVFRETELFFGAFTHQIHHLSLTFCDSLSTTPRDRVFNTHLRTLEYLSERLRHVTTKAHRHHSHI